MRRATRRLAPLLVLVSLAACEQSAAERGGALFRDPKGFSESNLNKMSCATCHEVGPAQDSDGYRKAAYSLYGAPARAVWWGGNQLHLLDAVDQCIKWFLRGDPLDRESDEAKQLYEYLLSITPDDAPSAPLPMTVVENITALAPGDAVRGAALYASHCAHCHGAMHTGADNNGISKLILPDGLLTGDYVTMFPTTPKGMLVIESIRHGRFFNVGGVMPFYPAELMSDADISDILAALDLSATVVRP